MKTNTQSNFSFFIASLGHARKPSQLEERRCSRVVLLGYKLPEQGAGAQCLVVCSWECRGWDLLVFKNKSVSNYSNVPLTYSVPLSRVAARRQLELELQPKQRHPWGLVMVLSGRSTHRAVVSNR